MSKKSEPSEWQKGRMPVEPTETPDASGREKLLEHPAFGTIQINRVNGDATLFGSEFNHQHFVTLTIRHADMRRELSQDWIHGHKDIIEVAMSEAQFAAMISSLNQGTGTPCTIEHIQGKPVPMLPRPRIQSEAHEQDAMDRLKEIQSHIDAAIADVEADLQGLSKVKRERIIERLRRARAQTTSGIPFIAKSLREHMETVVQTAKVEIHSYANRIVQTMGLNAISGGAKSPIALPEGNKKEDATE